MVIATQLVLLRLLFSDLAGGLVSKGIAIGDDGTVVFRPSGAFEIVLHFSTGAPQRNELFQNADTGNPESEPGISPVKPFPETLKSCTFGKLKPTIGPVNPFSSSLRVSKWVK